MKRYRHEHLCHREPELTHHEIFKRIIRDWHWSTENLYHNHRHHTHILHIWKRSWQFTSKLLQTIIHLKYKKDKYTTDEKRVDLQTIAYFAKWERIFLPTTQACQYIVECIHCLCLIIFLSSHDFLILKIFNDQRVCEHALIVLRIKKL